MSDKKHDAVTLPARKATNALFAFSGLDGTVDFHSQLVGSVMDEDCGLGLIITFPLEMALWCETRHQNDCKIKKRLVLSDALKYCVSCNGNDHEIVSLMAYDRTVVGQTTRDFPVCIKDAHYGRATKVICGRQLIEENGTLAVILQKAGADGVIRFSCSIGGCEAEAAQQAQKALDADIEKMLVSKKHFFDQCKPPDTGDTLVDECYYKALSVLRSMVYSADSRTNLRWTTPDRMPHRKMWLWDSAFHALGLQYIDPVMAQEAIEAVLSYQSEDGFICHMMSPGEVSGITQPPILAWAALKIFENNRDIEFLERVFEPILRFVQWFLSNRKMGKTLGWKIKGGFPVCCNADETGMDNTPRFDNVENVEAIDLISFIANEISALNKIASVTGQTMPENLTSLRQLLKEQIQTRFWDADEDFFYDRSVAGEFVKIKTCASFTPLFAGLVTDRQAAAMVEHLKNPSQFWGGFPVPSTAFSEPRYTRDYWRGPTWVNYNYLIIEGLRIYGHLETALELVRITLEQVALWYGKTGILWELYDPQGMHCPADFLKMNAMLTKRLRCLCGGAVADFGWTAALFVHLCNENKIKNRKN